MKKIIVLLILIISLSNFSQQKGLIYYGQIDALGYGEAKGIDLNSYMVFNKEQSYYVTAKDSLEKPDAGYQTKTIAKDDGSGGVIINGMGLSPQGEQVVFNTKEKTICSNILDRVQVYVKEDATVFDWKILKEKKKIGKYNCRKAITHFRGRDYMAWFTLEIPVPYGPWKLNGLPGLILEASDSEKYISWYFKKLEYPTKNKSAVVSIRKSKNEKNVKFLTIEEFKKNCENEIQRREDKIKLVAKQFPDVTLTPPKMEDSYIERF